MQQNGTPVAKGTYSTSGNNMTITITHMYESGAWYTKADLLALGSGYFTESDFSMTGTYSLNGNTLIITFSGQSAQTYTRQ